MKKLLLWAVAVAVVLIITIRLGSSPASGESDLFRYQNAYVGNNSAVGAIVGSLSVNKNFKEMALQTKEKPYGIVLKYVNTDGTAAGIQGIAVTNAFYLFALIQNVDWVEVDTDAGASRIKRSDLGRELEGRLAACTNEEELNELVQEVLGDAPRVKELLK